MKRTLSVVGLLCAALWTTQAHAQLIGGVAVNTPTVKVGEPLTVTATIDVVSGNYCGFAIFFGDGKQVESVSDIHTPMPFVTTHTYTTPGQYTISIGGRHVQSHPNCGGADKFASVTVVAAAPTAKPTAANACPAGWKLVPKSFNSKTGAFACTAKAGTAMPSPVMACYAKLKYFEDSKKNTIGCKP